MILKKTELEVEVDKLYSDSEFWYTVYEQVEKFFSSLARDWEQQITAWNKAPPNLDATEC
jgi:hypothetical protein